MFVSRRTAGAIALIFVMLLIAAGSLHVYAQGSAAGTPFKVGRTYHLEYLGTDADIKVLSGPDSNGFVAATVIRGFDQSSRSGVVWVNVRMAILARETGGQ